MTRLVQNHVPQQDWFKITSHRRSYKGLLLTESGQSFTHRMTKHVQSKIDRKMLLTLKTYEWQFSLYVKNSKSNDLVKLARVSWWKSSPWQEIPLQSCLIALINFTYSSLDKLHLNSSKSLQQISFLFAYYYYSISQYWMAFRSPTRT